MKSFFQILSFCLLVLILFPLAGIAQNKTQAVLGLKEGGEWEWVTKSNGTEQYEYKGGAFKPVTSLKVDKKHTDHSFDIQMEGPAWESDKVGYRIYLDWRNAIDIFGKKTDKPVLHKVGLDGFDSYHEMSDWGVDVLKVGSSLGLGSIAFWDGEKANRVAKTDSLFSSIKNLPTEAQVNIIYSGWETGLNKLDLHTQLSIKQGSYFTKYDLNLSKELPNLATGIVKLPNTKIISPEGKKGEWNYFATFGIQTLQDDYLGMAIFFKTDDLIAKTADKYSHVLVLKPEGKKLTYYFGAVWEHDASGIKTEEAFVEFLEKEKEKLTK